MKEQKSMIELVRRNEGYRLSSFEIFGFGVLLFFFLFMLFEFVISPNL